MNAWRYVALRISQMWHSSRAKSLSSAAARMLERSLWHERRESEARAEINEIGGKQ